MARTHPPEIFNRSFSVQPSIASLKEMSPRIAAQVTSSPPALDHALTLLGQFTEAEDELLPWMQETEAELPRLSPNYGSYSDIREQQQHLQVRNLRTHPYALQTGLCSLFYLFQPVGVTVAPWQTQGGTYIKIPR